MNDAPLFVGIDVSKKTLDVYLLADQSKQLLSFDNTAGGIATLIDRLRPLNVRLSVLEAAGRYERRCGVGLMSHGFEVAIVNPRQPLDFAKAARQLAKIDRIAMRSPCRALARRRVPARFPWRTRCFWTSLVARRRQVVQMLAQEDNRLQQAFDKKI